MSGLQKIYNDVSSGAGLFFKSLLSLVKLALRARKLKPLPQPVKERCAILGNGPSLTESLKGGIEFVKSCDIVCVNNSILSEYFSTLKPSDYVFLDEYYFIFDNVKHAREDIKTTIHSFTAVDWPMNVFVPSYGKNSYFVTTVLNSNKFITVCYFNQVIVDGYEWFKFPIYKSGLGMPQCQSVLGACIYLSINRGYKETYIFGADHSWHETLALSDANGIMLTNSHFYDKTAAKSLLYPQYGGIANFFFSLYKTFKGYDVLDDYARYRNVKVYNASHKSYIDAFERKKVF
ncbi:MAG: hypothetical protein WAQ28_02410 [Bacteroidia bacterium]|jgi:hypothetical protein